MEAHPNLHAQALAPQMLISMLLLVTLLIANVIPPWLPWVAMLNFSGVNIHYDVDGSDENLGSDEDNH